MERLRGIVREEIAERPLTREELIEAVGRRRGFKRVAEGLRSGWGTLLKPIAWQGDLVFGPSAGTRVTFTTPQAASPRWAGLPEPDEAAPIAIRAYLGAYGPATVEAFSFWVAGGWFSRARLRGWFADLGDELVEVDVDGDRAWILAEHADEMAETEPTAAVRLLPGFDQFVLGPGTKDAHVTPSRATRGREPDGGLDLTGRRFGRCGERDLGARRHRRPHCLVQRGRSSAAPGHLRRGRQPLDAARCGPPTRCEARVRR